MTKVFISLPMRNRTNEEIKSRMNDILEKTSKLLKDELILLDTVIDDEEPEESKHGCWYLGKSISMMSEADFVIFDYNWRGARGCRIERQVCEFYGIPYYTIMTENDPWSCDITWNK